MKTFGSRFIVTWALLLLFAALPAAAQGHFPAESWERVAVEEAGFAPDKFAAVLNHAAAMDSLAGMVIYDGRVVHEWGDCTRKGQVHSVRKSLISALYGIYAREGAISLTATLGQLGIDDKPPVLTATERTARVVDLLKARSGVYHEAAYETASMKAARPPRGSHAPDTFWYYNNWDFNALGTIFEKQTGRKIGEAFYERIAGPIGMQDYRPADMSYYFDKVSEHPAYRFAMSARDLARFGLLYMRGGEWAGKQVVPREWVGESTRAHSAAGPGVGYGYLWWVAKGWLLGNKIGVEAFRADGHGGQFVVVIPAYKLVVVHLANFDKSKSDSRAQFGQLMGYLLAARQGN